LSSLWRLVSIGTSTCCSDELHNHHGNAIALRVGVAEFPAFNEDEVRLLVSSVEQSLRHLRDANERVGGDDPELIDYGKQYSDP
jgi:hypothetical protein